MYSEMTAATFADVESKFWDVVRCFHRKFPHCDVDETTSAALEAFLKAYTDYDPAIAQDFEGYVCRRVWYDMWTAWRSAVRRNRRFRLGKELGHAPDPRPAREDWTEWLSDDEKEVARIVLNAPRDVARTVRRLGDTPANTRYAVRAYLKGLGWGVKRTTDAFNGIKQLL